MRPWRNDSFCHGRMYHFRITSSLILLPLMQCGRRLRLFLVFHIDLRAIKAAIDPNDFQRVSSVFSVNSHLTRFRPYCQMHPNAMVRQCNTESGHRTDNVILSYRIHALVLYHNFTICNNKAGAGSRGCTKTQQNSCGQLLYPPLPERLFPLPEG